MESRERERKKGRIKKEKRERYDGHYRENETKKM